MYRSAPRTITPQERCNLSLVITHPVPIEARGNRAISWPPVGVLLSRSSLVQLVKESESDCLSLLVATHQPDERAVAHELRLMLVGFLLVCATVLAKDSGKTACEQKTGVCDGSLTTAGCATCTPAGSSQTCLTCTTSSHKIRPDEKGCISECPADVSTDVDGFCKCKSGYTPSTNGQTCEQKTGVCDGSLTTAGCATCTPAGSSQTCLTCTTSSHKIRPDEKGCISECPADVSTDVDGFCKCKSGYTPSTNGQTCEQKTGVCDGSLTTAGCATCTPAGSSQTCLTCTTSSHKIRPDEKGCISECPADVSTDVDGFCKCKSGYTPSTNGQTCEQKTGVCDGSLTTAGCATCTPAGSSQTCLTCTTSSHKIRPDEKGCISECPADVSTDVDGFCKCKSGYTPSTNGQTCEPSNTNKSGGLSTGAIAGIAVAAIIVVGGLVGFLCWWFLCRGKA
eukprot:XP_001709860.1 VSP [Giardia lamblia ATCC 50803]